MEEALPIGSLLDSGIRTYRVERILGSGGFGITYLVSTPGDDGQPAFYAVKELFVKTYCQRQNGVVTSSPLNATEIENCRASFLGEAKRLAQLSASHGNIVKVNESFSANGTSYYVMEYLHGPSLRSLVEQNNGGGLDWQKVLSLVQPIADALEFLHSNRINHLDVKPDNVILDTRYADRPVLIDFGLSKRYDVSNNPTSTIRVSGYSNGYSPMEQYVGLSSFSPQADVYALAATMLFLLTGHDPAVATQMTEEYVIESLNGKVPIFAVSGFVQALKLHPDERTATVGDFMRSVTEMPQGAAPVAQPTIPNLGSAPTRIVTEGLAPEAPPRSRSKFAIMFAAFAVILAGGLIFFLANKEDKKATEYNPEYYGEEAVAETDIPPVTGRNRVENFILASPSQTVGGQMAHFFAGDFLFKGKFYPVMLAFVEDGGVITKVVYKNVNYSTVLNMNFSFSGDNLQLTNPSLNLTLNYNGYGRLEGVADGDITMEASLEATTDSFSF